MQFHEGILYLQKFKLTRLDPEIYSFWNGAIPSRDLYFLRIFSFSNSCKFWSTFLSIFHPNFWKLVKISSVKRALFFKKMQLYEEEWLHFTTIYSLVLKIYSILKKSNFIKDFCTNLVRWSLEVQNDYYCWIKETKFIWLLWILN